jgi:ribose transport system permease protein
MSQNTVTGGTAPDETTAAVMGQAATPVPPSRRTTAELWHATRRFRPVLVLLIALVVVFSVSQSAFPTTANIQNLATSVSELWVMAMGMTFVLISGGADLSVSAIAAVVGIFMAKIIGVGVPGGVAVLLTILAGAAIGAGINGFLVGKLKMSFFVVTLASSIALTGVVNVWTNTQSFYVTAPIVNQIAIDHIAGLPTAVWLMAAVFLAAILLQKRTYFGRDVFAVGGSATAAHLSGIRASRTLILVYALSGACAGLGGVIGVGRIGAASPAVDPNLPLQAIAAVLLGGTTLTGGAGSVIGTALGVLFIGTLQNGLGIAGVPSFWQQVVTGVILAVAVFGDRTAGRGVLRRMRTSRRARSDQAPLIGDTEVS